MLMDEVAAKARTISPREKRLLFDMAIGNEKFMHECFPKQSCMGTARMK